MQGVFNDVINAGYHEFERAIAGVHSPGPFLLESRFQAVSNVACERWSALPEEVLVHHLTVAYWVAINHRPEAVRHLLDRHIHLIEVFPENLDELVRVCRDLWLDAPSNQTGRAHRGRAELEDLASGKRKRHQEAMALEPERKNTGANCLCPPSAVCVYGRHSACACQPTTIQRAQPYAMHCERAGTLFNASESKSDQASEMAMSAKSLATFLQADLPQLVSAVTSGGEIDVWLALQSKKVIRQGTEEHKGVRFISDVRANMMSRGVFHAFAKVKLRRHRLHEGTLPGDQAVPPYLAPKPLMRLLAFVQQYGATLSPSQQQEVGRSMLQMCVLYSGPLTEAWAHAKLKKHPCLGGVLRMMLEEMMLKEQWDINRLEEPACDWPKDLIGLHIAAGELHASDALHGYLHSSLASCGEQTPTGFAPVPATCEGYLATWASDGSKHVKALSLAPCSPLQPLESLSCDSNNAASELQQQQESNASDAIERHLQRQVNAAEKQLHEAMQAKEKAAVLDAELCHHISLLLAGERNT